MIDSTRALRHNPMMAMVKLDDRDIKILSILTQDGRISKTDLAKRINLSPTPCWERLQRLERAGIITHYRAEISLAELTPHVTVLVMAELENHRAETFNSFEKAINHYDEITECWALGGGFDYLFQVITKDIDTYQQLIDDLLVRKTGLARYFTYIVTKKIKSSQTPPLDILLSEPTSE